LMSSRPGLDMGDGVWTNASAIAEVWRLFHSVAEDTTSPLFQFDYIDLVRQSLTFLFADVYTATMGAYRTKSAVAMHNLGELMMSLVADMDDILGTHRLWMVGPWINGARGWGGADKTDQDLLESNARHLISIWGPNGELNSYAMRHMSGMMNDYHGARWSLFLSYLTRSLSTNTTFDANAFNNECFEKIEKPWAETVGSYPTEPANSTSDVIDVAFGKYLGDSATIDWIDSLYEVHHDSDGTGDILGSFQAKSTDLRQLHLLCETIPECGGFIADGYLKPANTSAVSFPGSTLYIRKKNPQGQASLSPL